jgi:hypothetical protein
MLDPDRPREGLGPLAPWTAEVEVHGCRWQAETSWSAAAQRWTVRVGCEGALVGEAHLDDAGWASGVCRLVDADQLLDPGVRRALEVRLDEALIESVTDDVALAIRDAPALAALAARLRGDLGAPPRTPRRLARKQVARAIADAFAGDMPGSADELTTGGIDGPYVVEHFLGKDRDEVAAGFLPGLHMEDFTYMTEGAVAYYLPAILLLMMEPVSSFELWGSLHGFLRPRAAAFTPEQRAAIAAWASYLHDEWLLEAPVVIEPAEARDLALAYGATG